MLSSGDETIIHRTVIEHGIRRSASDWAVGGANTNTILKIAHQHEDEKRNLQGLNQKFGVYLERVKVLEVNNVKVKKQLDILRQNWGFDSGKIKGLYDSDLNSLRQQLDKMSYDKQSAQLRSKRAEYDASLLHHQTDFFHDFVVFYQNRLSALKQQLESSHLELSTLPNQLEDRQGEINQLKNEMKRQLDLMQALRSEFDREALARNAVEIEKQTLEEQMIFLKVVHEQERLEWTTLNTMSIDGGQFYRTELTRAIVGIKKDFEMLAQLQRQQWEEYYKTKIDGLHQQSAEHKRKMKEASRSGQVGELDMTTLTSSYKENRNQYEKLQKQNSDLLNQLQQLEEQFERTRYDRDRANTGSERQLLALQTQTQSLSNEITEIRENNISLQFEICVYNRLLETHEVQVREEKITTTYLTTISKKNFVLRKLKDLKKAIFIDISGSTSTHLYATRKTILQAEQSIYQKVAFDYIVIWDNAATLIEKLQVVEPSGGTSPQCIFQNQSTKNAFQNSDVIVFVTDGEVDHQSVTEFAKQTRNNLNKALIVGVIVNNKHAQPSQVNVSVVAPLMVASNVLCLFYDGQTFYVLSSKGYISKFYQSPTSLADYNSLKTLDISELFHNIDIHENVKLPDGFIPIRDNEEEIIGLHFKQFIGLTNLRSVIRMDEDEWTALIQYGKINNRLDELRKFVIKMRDAAAATDKKTIRGNQQNDIKSVDYWNNVEKMIRSQASGSYSMNDFMFASNRPT